MPVQQPTTKPHPVELLRLLLQGLLFELLDEIHLLEEPHLTAAQAFQLPADVAVDLGLDLSGNTHISTSVKHSEQARAALITNYCLSVAIGIFGVIYFSKIHHSHPKHHMTQISNSSRATFKEVSKNNVICNLSLF